MYIGNVHLPAIETANIGGVKRPTEAIGGLGHRGYNVAEFDASLPAVSLSGHLLQTYGGTRTLQQCREDVGALAQRKVGYNSATVKGRSGWISVSGVDVDDEVGELWPVTIEGIWYDASQYNVKYSSNPVTMANDFGITGSYDQSAVAAADDVQCFDGSLEIFSTHHTFSGNCTIKNGRYQVVLSENTLSVYYMGLVYTKIDDFTAGSFDHVTLISLNEDLVKVKTSNGIVVELERGRVPHIHSPVSLEASSLSISDQSTSTDNSLTLEMLGPVTGTYVCSNEDFSISSEVIDAGHLWFFYAESSPADVAHDALVVSNLKRQVVER